MLKSVRAAVVGLALFVLPTDSWALTSAFIDGVNGVWSTVSPDNGTVKFSGDRSRISWGRSSSGRKSGYVFNEIVNRGPHDLGQVFDLGQFTHINNPIFGSALTAASLAVTIAGRLVDDFGTHAFSVTSIFDVIHDETRNNQRTCPYGDRPPCGDLISFMTNAALSETFEFNGVVYLFEASGFLGGFLNGNSLFSDENQRNRAIMQGKLTAIFTPPPSPVPLPAAFPLFAGAVGAVAWLARRKKIV